MYHYKGSRTVDDLYAFATGGWEQTAGKVRRRVYVRSCVLNLDIICSHYLQ